MQRNRAYWEFLIILTCTILFIWLTSDRLPEVVASHFIASGVANGFMPRTSYIWFILGFVIILPSIMVFSSSIILNSSQARINLPNKEYWLAPIRRDQTIKTLQKYMVHIGSILVIFLAYVHWLVVCANALNPPKLPALWIIGGLSVFILLIMAWAVALIRRFRMISYH
jgi:hypothetical protein